MNPRAPLALAFALACGDTEPAPAPAAADPCPEISMDTLDGRWIKYAGKADQTWRFEIASTGTQSGAPELWLTSGGWTKRRMVGERRANDWQFTEVPDERRQRAFEAGDQSLMRLYVEPYKQKCSLRTSQVELSRVEGADKERPKPGFVEYVAFPDTYTFTFRPCDDAAFFGAAARDKKVADKQLAELGTSDPSSPLGDALEVGAWSDPAADGDAACTYDMDLFFDDQPAKDKDGNARGPVAAQPAADGARAWRVDDWYAPYSGNHHFQLFRHRTCADGARTLIGVSCVEAVLQ